MAYQSLYRRYRPGRFDEVVGQEHVVTALKNAVRENRVGHAYLFSGPRGTGKTSSARILAKALNCTDLEPDGEPCGRCESCLAFAAGSSYDLHELDAASNNKVDDIRDLIGKVALASPGRTKVYILDEVHMLTSGAENALLKTLEEPPPHVVFVLATTEPHKVVPTIRSRTQHYEFDLISAAALADHVRHVATDAGLAVDDTMVEYVVRTGAGSARDTLSALDQVVAAGSVLRDDGAVAAIVDGLAARDGARVVGAADEALRAGRDPRVIGEQLLARLRDAFLVTMGAAGSHLSDLQRTAAEELGSAMGPAALTRSMEVLGTALVDMRQAPDPRIDLEVALLRLSRPDLDTDLAAIVARLERLESGAVVAPPAPTAAVRPAAAPAPRSPATGGAPPSPATTAPDAPPTRTTGGGRAAQARAALRSARGDAAPTDPVATGPVAEPPSAEPPVAGGAPAPDAPRTSRPKPTFGGSTRRSGSPPADGTSTPPALDEPGVVAAMAAILPNLSGRARSRFSAGVVQAVDADTVVYALPNAIHRDRCQECAPEVETALGEALGRNVALRLVVGDGDTPADERGPDPGPGSHGTTEAEPADDDEIVDVTELADASPTEAGGLAALTEAFPGAEFIDPPDQPGR